MGISVDDIEEAPWNAYSWRGATAAIGGVGRGVPAKDDVEEVLYHGKDPDRWDGAEAAVVLLKDGRLAAWESVWGPTGSGFREDAYGGDAEVWFSRPGAINTLVLQALTDHGRELCGIPKGGIA